MADTTTLTAVKRALDITANIYDDELKALIDDAAVDLAFNDFDTSHEIDATVQRAINLFCGWQFNLMHGDTVRAEKLETAYNSLKTQLGTSSAYNVNGGGADA